MDINPRLVDKIVSQQSNNIYKESFYDFFCNVAFPAIFPSKQIKTSKSTEILCAVAEIVSKGTKGWHRVIVNIPPGLMKSTILSAALPAWHIGRNASERIFGISNTDKLVTRNVGWTKLIMKSQKYNKIFPDIIINKDTENHIKTSVGGERQGFSTLGNITGERCDFLIPDDYMSSIMIRSEAERTKALKNWDEAFYERVDKLTGKVLIIEQRLSIFDLTGYLSRTRPGQYKVISLPAYFENETTIEIGNKKFYFEKNELLSPYLTWEEIEIKRNSVVDPETGIANGKEVFFAQYMQNPLAKTQDRVNMDWFQPFEISKVPYMKFERVVVSVDSAQKPNEINDPSAFLKFGIVNNSKFLIDCYCERKVYPETREELIKFCLNGHKATDLIIEDANTGSSLLQEFIKENRLYDVRIIPIKHKGINKEIRFDTATGNFADKSYYFPRDATWYPDFENELMQFPKGRHDDMVDCLGQFANWYKDQNTIFEYFTMCV
jgi:predicted phage terminase large subunit-like protein